MSKQRFIANPPLPDRGNLPRKLYLADLEDKKHFGSPKTQSRLDKDTRDKLAVRSLLRDVFEGVGSQPQVPIFGGKDEVQQAEKFRIFCEYLFIAMLLVGYGITHGGGPGVMAEAARIFYELRARMKAACKTARIKPLWRAKIACISLDIPAEPLNGYFDEGLHAGPFRDLSTRSNALMCVGWVPGILNYPGGDSTILEYLMAKCALKPSQRAYLETPFSGYPGDPPLVLVDDEARPIFSHLLEMQRQMAASDDPHRRERKLDELRKLEGQHLLLNGDLRGAAERAFALIDTAAGYIYGENPADVFLRRNNLEVQLFTLVERFRKGEPLR